MCVCEEMQYSFIILDTFEFVDSCYNATLCVLYYETLVPHKYGTRGKSRKLDLN